MNGEVLDNGPFYSETQKVRPLVEKYFLGMEFILDYGCGNDLITPKAIGIDLVKGSASHILKDEEEVYDYGHEQGWQGKVDGIFSSHFLEHIEHDILMLRNWIDLLKKKGVLVLYLPDDNYYDNAANPDHLQIYKHQAFVKKFDSYFGKSMKLLNHGLDVGHDRYSFYIVARKRI